PTPASSCLPPGDAAQPPVAFPTRRSSDLGILVASREAGRTGRRRYGPKFLSPPLAQHEGCLRRIGDETVHRPLPQLPARMAGNRDRKSTRLNSSHEWISYAVFCLTNVIGS